MGKLRIILNAAMCFMEMEKSEVSRASKKGFGEARVARYSYFSAALELYLGLYSFLSKGGARNSRVTATSRDARRVRKGTSDKYR